MTIKKATPTVVIEDKLAWKIFLSVCLILVGAFAMIFRWEINVTGGSIFTTGVICLILSILKR